MPYTIERISNPPVYLITYGSDFDIETEIKKSNTEVMGLFEDDDAEKFAYIIDIRKMPLSLGTIISGTKVALDLEINPGTHPKVSKTIMITENKMIQRSMDGFVTFGLIKTALVASTVDEALEIARSS